MNASKRFRHVRAGTVVLGSVLLLTGSADAEDHPVQMNDMVVTATPTARDADTLPAAVTIITADDIARTSAQTVPDVLKYVVGLEVTDWYGTSRRAVVDIRGFGETAAANTLVLVDGRRVNAIDLSGVDWTLIPLRSVERIEVSRGGAGVVHGNMAVGGIINIITKKGADRPTVLSETTVTSDQGFGQSLGYSGSEGALRYDVSGAYSDTDGYRTNSYFRNRSSGLRLHYDNEAWGAWDLTAGAKSDQYGLPGARLATLERREASNPYDHGESKEEYITFTPTVCIGESGHLSLALNYREMQQHSIWPSLGGAATEFIIREYGVKPKYSQTVDVFGRPSTVTAGVDFTAADLNHLSSPDQDMHRHEAGYYIYDHTTLVDGELHLDLGYRRARINHDQHAYMLLFFGSTKIPDRAYNVDAARIGLTWTYAPGSRAFVAFDRTYRSQLVDEVGGPWGGNIPLNPQISQHYQAGVRHHFSRWLTAGATVFQIDTCNEIFYNPVIFQNVNYDNTRRRGIELEFESTPAESVRIFANYTLMDPELKDDAINAFDGNRIPGVAPQSGSAGVTVSPLDHLMIDVRGRWVKGKKMISDWNNTSESWGDSWVVIDTQISYTIGCVTLYAGVNNLFDTEYSEYAAYWANAVNLYPSPERSFVGGMKVLKEF